MQEGFCLVLVELWLVADAGQNSGLFLILCVQCVVLCVCSCLLKRLGRQPGQSATGNIPTEPSGGRALPTLG